MHSFSRPTRGVHIENNKFIFNGVDLSNEVVVENIKRTLIPSKNVRNVDIPGMDGSMFMGFNYGVRKVTVDIRIVEVSFEDAILKQHSLAMVLSPRTPKELHLKDLDILGAHNVAVLTSEVDLERKGDTLAGQLEFTCYSPFNYSNTERYSVLTSTPKAIRNEGVEVAVKFNLQFTSAISNDITISTNDGQNLIFKGPFSAYSTLEYDNFKVRINGNLMNQRLDFINSTFINLKTGFTEMSVSGMDPNVCTVIFREAKL